MEQILLIGHLEKGEDLKDGHPSISSELKWYVIQLFCIDFYFLALYTQFTGRVRGL